MRLLIIFIFLMSNLHADEALGIKNLIINKDLKKYESLTFQDDKNNQINLNEFRGNLVLLNFWATWCAPCKEEMPSLDQLKLNKSLNNLKIFPINIGKDSLNKSLKFFDDLEIKNLNIDNVIRSDIYKLIISNNYTLANILHSDLVFIQNNFRKQLLFIHSFHFYILQIKILVIICFSLVFIY